MKNLATRALATIGIGFLVIVPVYLCVLLLAKALSTARGFLGPILAVLPDWMHHETLLALALLIVVSFVVGALVPTRIGEILGNRVARPVLERVPGYTMFRRFVRGVAGDRTEMSWRPALVDGGNSLTLVFVIEELPDGRYTVFVPSVPTPLAGAVYVYDREVVHLVDVPFAQAAQVISHWGEGTRRLVASMRSAGPRG